MTKQIQRLQQWLQIGLLLSISLFVAACGGGSDDTTSSDNTAISTEEGQTNSDSTSDDDSSDDQTPDDEDGGDENNDDASSASGTGFVITYPMPNRDIKSVSNAQARAASRFLSQASLGANYATITQVAEMGAEAWMEQQFAIEPGYLAPYSHFLEEKFESYGNEDTAGELLGEPEDFFKNSWWTQAISSPDMLRQRVAFALSEIFVVSGRVSEIGDTVRPLTGYYDTLLTHSFGNYKDLLLAVTLHPSMGIYLSHINNAKADATKGTFPDENYAREVMQLFSIGLFELNQDGSQKLDGNNNPIPTYDNARIREFAKVFTGLTYGPDGRFGASIEETDQTTFSHAMVMHENYHDTSAKQLLSGQVLPAGQTGMKDINDAIDNLFNHPNVGPFFGRLMIQRLVTSNPSPAYISRVAGVFNDNGAGVRGDMKAFIKAILFDQEALTSSGSSAGKLREPFIRMVHLLRAFNATSTDRTFNTDGVAILEATGQFALLSPSVFNFFQPDFSPNGVLKDNQLVAPEFQITHAATIIAIKNLIDNATLGKNVLSPDDEYGLYPRVNLDISHELSLADSPEQLLNYLDTLLTYGTLSNDTRQAIITAITGVEEKERKVLLAIYLMMISPDYAIAA